MEGSQAHYFSYISLHHEMPVKMKNGVILSLHNKKKAETSCKALKDYQQKVIDDLKAVSEIFNDFSTNTGTILSVALPQTTTDFRQYFDLPILQHPKFDFHLIGVQEIIDILKSFDQKFNRL